LAKRLADGELATTFSGTRPYMAPEILLTALGDMAGYDWRVDWWALGCCFYEMLRGRTPYEYPASFSSLQVSVYFHQICFKFIQGFVHNLYPRGHNAQPMAFRPDLIPSGHY
jgi:serine/threonine protein kinase